MYSIIKENLYFNVDLSGNYYSICKKNVFIAVILNIM